MFMNSKKIPKSETKCSEIWKFLKYIKTSGVCKNVRKSGNKFGKSSRV